MLNAGSKLVHWWSSVKNGVCYAWGKSWIIKPLFMPGLVVFAAIIRCLKVAGRALRRHILLRWVALAQSKPGTAAALFLVAVSLTVVISGLFLRWLSPVIFVEVKDFEVLSGSGSPVSITGKGISKLLTDQLANISYVSRERGYVYTSQLTHSAENLQNHGLDIETSIGAVSFWGISLQTLASAWNLIRTRHSTVEGELVFDKSGHVWLSAHHNSEGGPQHWEVMISGSGPDALRRGCEQLSHDIVSAIAPQTLGRFYLNQHEYVNALSEFRKWERLDPDDPTMYFYIGWTYARAANESAPTENPQALSPPQQQETAKTAFTMAMERSPHNPEVLNEMGNLVLRAHHRAGDALPFFQAASALREGEDPTFLQNIGYSLYQEQRFQEAVSFYRQALRRDVHFAGAWYNFAITVLDTPYELLSDDLFRQCASKRSLHFGKSCVDLSMKWPFVSYYAEIIPVCPYLGDSRILCKRFTAAYAYEQALRLRPDDFPDALPDLSRVFIQQGRLEHAKVLLEEALRKNSQHPFPPCIIVRTYTNFGLIAFARRNYTEAIRMFTRALKIVPRTRWNYVDRANAYDALKQRKHAATDRRTAAQLSSADTCEIEAARMNQPKRSNKRP